MLLPVLPGPEIIFRPVHEKSSANSGKCLANFRPQILLANFFSPAPLELFGRNFSHLATLATAQPPTPHFPLPLPPLPLTPPIPSSPPTDCLISQILKDDYRLPFCEIIILCQELYRFRLCREKTRGNFLMIQSEGISCPLVLYWETIESM
jgi:hypothetical protein